MLDILLTGLALLTGLHLLWSTRELYLPGYMNLFKLSVNVQIMCKSATAGEILRWINKQKLRPAEMALVQPLQEILTIEPSPTSLQKARDLLADYEQVGNPGMREESDRVVLLSWLAPLSAGAIICLSALDLTQLELGSSTAAGHLAWLLVIHSVMSKRHWVNRWMIMRWLCREVILALHTQTPKKKHKRLTVIK